MSLSIYQPRSIKREINIVFGKHRGHRTSRRFSSSETSKTRAFSKVQSQTHERVRNWRAAERAEGSCHLSLFASARKRAAKFASESENCQRVGARHRERR